MTNVRTFKFGIPLGIIAAILILYQTWTPLVQPAITAALRALESLQVAHAAAPQFPKSSTVGDMFNNATWYSIDIMGAENSKSCRPVGSMDYLGYHVFHKEAIEKECTPENIGNFLENFFKKIRETIKGAPPDAQAKIEASIDKLREAAIKQGVKFSTPVVPPAP